MTASDSGIVDRIAEILEEREYLYVRSDNLLGLSFSGEPTEIRLIFFGEPTRTESASYLVCLGALQVPLDLQDRVRILDLLNTASLKLPLGGYEFREDDKFGTITFKYGFEIFDGKLTADMIEATMSRVVTALREIERDALRLVKAPHPG